MKYIGAHVSSSGGIFNAIRNARNINANSIAFFLKNQRRWDFRPLDEDSVRKFKEYCVMHHFSSSQIIPHGSYLVNLGNPNKDIRSKSFQQFVADLKRCEQLGIQLYNFHPGSSVGQCDRHESIELIADAINAALGVTQNVTCVIENMAGQGNSIGRDFDELRNIIDLVVDQDRIGVCLDTCHLFAAGYDIRTSCEYEKVMTQFGSIVGFPFLKAMHLNDSKFDLGSSKDRHENIGEGKIGIDAFRFIMNDSRLDGIPMILETPDSDKWKFEIELLISMVEG
jgi:apurinic endonuclease APN1